MLLKQESSNCEFVGLQFHRAVADFSSSAARGCSRWIPDTRPRRGIAATHCQYWPKPVRGIGTDIATGQHGGEAQ
jgi:hypothetical protein